MRRPKGSGPPEPDLPGGKALERLRQMERERGLKPDETLDPEQADRREPAADEDTDTEATDEEEPEPSDP